MSGSELGRWIEHSHKVIYESSWVSLETVDIETPSGQRFDHHVVRCPRWTPEALRLGVHWHPSNGLIDQTFHVAWTDHAVNTGPPTDIDEATEISFHPVASIGAMITSGEITDGLSLTSLCWWLSCGPDRH